MTANALGRRIEMVDAIADMTTRYYYDDQRAALQTTVSGGVETDARYFAFGNYIDEVLVMADVDSANSVPNGDYYYGHDHLFSPLFSPAALFNAAGSVVERYEYDAYGKVSILSPNYELRTASLYANSYSFTGRELDTLDNHTLPLMYYRARTYDPETGRFMQKDPLGINPAGGEINNFEIQKQYVDGMNIYQYVLSNPVNNIDQFGLKCGIQSYRNRVGNKHAGILINGADYDFGPVSLNPFWAEGQCPWRLGGIEYQDDKGNAKPPKVRDLEIRSMGLLWHGQSRGKPCKCATCDDIISCIIKVCQNWDGTKYVYPIRTCWNFVAAVKSDCCLK